MEANYLVTKSNYFIMNSSYDLSLEEQKIILTLASMVQPDDDEFKTYKFKIADFMELLGVENQAKYTVIPKITKELMKKVFVENNIPTSRHVVMAELDGPLTTSNMTAKSSATGVSGGTLAPKTSNTVAIAVIISVVMACAVDAVISRKNLNEIVED